jgi:recombination associated protein RdgC
VRLALSWQDQVEFVVDKDLSLRRIRFSDELRGINEEIHEDVLARRDADCLLMGETLETLKSTLAKTFGGLSE